MKRRIITLQVEIEDKEKASWIWDNHMNHDGSHGIYITAIQSGPIFRTDENEQEKED